MADPIPKPAQEHEDTPDAGGDEQPDEQEQTGIIPGKVPGSPADPRDPRFPGSQPDLA
ncbi:hypothetical protein JL100_019715 [Skermanella mucosa]|uniref:hypothetical protein n=1 Tax=Skermanella mucosa TaxID=1789672 RepID=UPI00192CD1EF|nr:hypothetical protein [Skermanella mucosa]UEM19308.1 hypothetical protein JL100_019715 [Skermanella mucosa]